KMPEAHLFFTTLAFPHGAFGATLIIVSLWLSLSVLSPITGPLRRVALAIAAGFANLALGITYPFLIYLIALTLGLYVALRMIQARRVLWQEGVILSLAFLIPAPLYLYYISTLASNPVFRAWEAQSITLSPPLPHYLIAYGVMLTLSILPLLQGRNAVNDPSGRFDLLWCWLIAAALMVYAPINPQRRFVEGLQIPLSILATRGLVQIGLPWLRNTGVFRRIASRRGYSAWRLEGLAVMLFIAGMSISNVYLFASVSITAAIQQPYPFFRSRAETDAVTWLSANAKAGEVVLSGYETGSYIGALTPQRVVVGHWAETVNYEDKLKEVATFFNSATTDETRAEILSRENVSYVWVGEEERAVGKFDPQRADHMQPVFVNSDIAIYRVEGH
ncbi:MAG TPA: hypothetical protein VIX58_11880, partial [Anaerolineae bacterium]